MLKGQFRSFPTHPITLPAHVYRLNMEWSLGVFRKICEHAHKDYLTGLHLNFCLLHLLKLSSLLNGSHPTDTDMRRNLPYKHQREFWSSWGKWLHNLICQTRIIDHDRWYKSACFSGSVPDLAALYKTTVLFHSFNNIAFNSALDYCQSLVNPMVNASKIVEGSLTHKSRDLQSSDLPVSSPIPPPPMINQTFLSSTLETASIPTESLFGYMPTNKISTHIASDSVQLKSVHWKKLTHIQPSSIWVKCLGNLEDNFHLNIDFDALSKLFGNTGTSCEIGCSKGVFEKISGKDSASLVGKFPFDGNRLFGNTVQKLGVPTPHSLSSRPYKMDYARRSASVGRKLPSVRKHSEPIILESQRCLNIGIFLRQFRASSLDLYKLVDGRQSLTFGAERLRGLIKLLPNEQEEKFFVNYSGDPTQLDPAEQFCYHLVRVPNYSEKLDSMLLQEEFPTFMRITIATLLAIISSAEAILNSKTLPILFDAILKVGNFLNQRTRLGSARGIKLESLLSVSDVRSTGSKWNLLHFLVEHFRRTNDVLNIQTEFPKLADVISVCAESLKKDIEKMRFRFEMMKRQMNAESQTISDECVGFIEIGEHDLNTAQRHMESVGKLERDCAEYFSEDSANFKLSNCFSTLYAFFAKMKTAENDLQMHSWKIDEQRETSSHGNNIEERCTKLPQYKQSCPRESVNDPAIRLKRLSTVRADQIQNREEKRNLETGNETTPKSDFTSYCRMSVRKNATQLGHSEHSSSTMLDSIIMNNIYQQPRRTRAKPSSGKSRRNGMEFERERHVTNIAFNLGSTKGETNTTTIEKNT